jgi:hypothetical protein
MLVVSSSARTTSSAPAGGGPAAERATLKEISFVVKTGPGAILHAIEREPRSGHLSASAR